MIHEISLDFDFEYLKSEWLEYPTPNGVRHGINVYAPDIPALEPIKGTMDCIWHDYWEISYTREVLDSLDINYGRTRFLTLPPGSIMKFHQDYKRRFHIPVDTHEWCGFFDEHMNLYHMPEGKVSVLDAVEWHSAFNSSRFKSRTHLVIEEL